MSEGPKLIFANTSYSEACQLSCADVLEQPGVGSGVAVVTHVMLGSDGRALRAQMRSSERSGRCTAQSQVFHVSFRCCLTQARSTTESEMRLPSPRSSGAQSSFCVTGVQR